MRLVSIKHTGTLFTLDFLEAASNRGWRGTHRHYHPWNWEKVKALPGGMINTLRDPLLVCVSNSVRSDNATFEKAIWENAATHLGQLQTFCIDLVEPTVEARADYLRGLATAAEVDAAPSVIQAWAERWPRVNSRSGLLKEAYENGDLATIERKIPETVSGLRALEPDLRPWLERLGYRDLLWWSK